MFNFYNFNLFFFLILASNFQLPIIFDSRFDDTFHYGYNSTAFKVCVEGNLQEMLRNDLVYSFYYLIISLIFMSYE